ncbi:MFS family permease [Arthrobacter sp. 1088]|uniref:MFS transporter n=1 Tax=Arthrobacter sp. 1088 TaxID=2817768 RepID=UPI002857AEF5|nr:MFS transporter [Arthrobacter sp. 1088]MDR6688630.1 MFS family permease [Arthrobacter sp. 1088]
MSGLTKSVPISDVGRSAYRKIYRRIVPLIMVMYLLSWMDRVNISFAALSMNNDLGLTATAFGLGAALFFVGYVLCEVPSNVIMQKVGARIWLARIMVTWGLVASGTAFIVGEQSFYVARILLGVAEAGFFPGVLLYLTLWVPSQMRGRITALFLMSAPIATVIGAPLASAAMVGLNGFLGLAGWQWLFLAFGIPTVVVGIAAFWLLPSTPALAGWLSNEERSFLVDQLNRERQESIGHKAAASALSALRNPRIIGFALAFIGLSCGSYILSFFLPQVIDSFQSRYGVKFSVMEIGLLTAVPFGIAAITMFFVARDSDRRQKRLRYVVGGELVAAAAFVLATLVDTPVLSMVMLSIAASGIYVAIPLYWELPGQYLSATTAGAGLALINSTGNISGFVGPYATGALKTATGSFDSGLILAAVALTIAAVAVSLVSRRPRRRLSESQSEQVESSYTESPQGV